MSLENWRGRSFNPYPLNRIPITSQSPTRCHWGGAKIWGDERKLSRALSNLLSNAVKFSESGGAIRLHMDEVDDETYALSITDKGIGISAEDLPRIAEPFEQGDISLSRSYEGLGLGIPLAQALIQLHGGDIDI
ncbi:MAG: sensor histidine kinase [Alphaproteobacteria bacterium]